MKESDIFIHRADFDTSNQQKPVHFTAKDGDWHIYPKLFSCNDTKNAHKNYQKSSKNLQNLAYTLLFTQGRILKNE